MQTMQPGGVKNSMRSFFTQPHPVIVSAVLVISCLMMWYSGSVLKQYVQPTGLDDVDLKKGTVQSVVHQSSDYNDLVRRTITVQTLKVQEGDQTYEVSNDIAPVSSGASVYIAYDTNNETYSVVQLSRAQPSLYLLIAFFVIVLLVTGLSGLRSLVGLMWSAG
ncbi:MAG: hypothetical protein AAB870_02930, partial [Patescibacteria group bacterium]